MAEAFYPTTATQSSATITNCLFWNNTTPANAADAGKEEINNPVFDDGDGNLVSASVTVNYSTVRDYTPGVTNVGGGNISTQDPLFANAADPVGADGRWATADDGLAIPATSPAKDAGDPASTLATDITDAPRTQPVDQGAYEAAGLPDLVVSSPQTIAAGAYNNITVTSTGVATLGGNVTVQGIFLVQAGGELNTSPGGHHAT